MAAISLTLPPCWPLPHALVPRDIPELACLGVDDIAAGEVKPGGRVVLVTAYDPNGQGSARRVCSGQYGQWQVLTGLGGQIHRGLLVGDSFKKDPSTVMPPGVLSTVDRTDCVKPGERAIAIRDRGRWYVTKLGAATEQIVSIMGGNTLGSGALGIKFVSELPRIDRVWDPDVDRDFPIGLGYAALYTDGVLSPKNVIVIHDWMNYRAPLISGLVLPVRSAMTLPIEPRPKTPPYAITVYRVGVYR